MRKELFNIYKNSKEYKIWPLKEDVFLNIINGNHKNDIDNQTKIFSKKIDNTTVGFISCKIKEDRGSIVFIFIDKRHRFKGLGSKLLKKSIEWFKTNKVKEITFGSGAGSYMFPGLPKNLEIEDFFRKNGFVISDDGLVDMYQDITNWEFPKDLLDKVEKEGVTIQFSSKDVGGKIMRFTKENFPNWYEYYKQDMENEDFHSVFYASINDEIVGISKLWIGDCTWDLLFENSIGGGGALGVSEKHRGKEIGLAMKAWGTQKVKERGVKYVWIGWTYAIDFYKKLGFEVWREYFKVKMVIS